MGDWAIKQGPQINPNRPTMSEEISWPGLPFAYDPDLIAADDIGAWMPPEAGTPEAESLQPRSHEDRVKDIQKVLAEDHTYAGEIDGLWEPRSQAAMTAFLKQRCGVGNGVGAGW